MIPLLGQILSIAAAATLDSSGSAIRFLGGLAAGERIAPSLWFDLGAQLDVHPAFVRYGVGIGTLDALSLDSRDMAPGQSAPDLEAYHHSFAGGLQYFWRSGWMAAGGGWNWNVVDTLRTASESRRLYTEDDGRLVYVDRSAAWVWKDRLRRSGPFGVVELGFGLRQIGMGFQFEFGTSNVVGLNLQYRIY